jgi:hypothetical protein
MTFTIRAAGVDDAEVVHRLTQAAFAEHARREPPSAVLNETIADVRAALSGTNRPGRFVPGPTSPRQTESAG